MAAMKTQPTSASSLDQAIIRQLLAAMHRARIVLARPTFLGVATAVLFLWGSLVPGLLPLSWSTQGIISGFWTALGYGLGTGVRGLYGKLVGWRPGNAVQRVAWIILAVLAGSLTAWSSIIAYQWQVDVRNLMGMSTAILYYPIAFVVVALLVAVVLVLTARLVRVGYQQFITVVSRYFPRAGAHTLAVLTNIVLVLFITDEVVGERLFPALDRRYLAGEARYDRNMQQPTSPYTSGGADSLISWETLGMQGRTFVAQGPGVAELTRFSGKAAMDPIRIYVGRRSAKTAAQRAELAIAELERTGAFRRDLLVIVNPTGSGWVDPYAITPLEYMYAGNTAG